MKKLIAAAILASTSTITFADTGAGCGVGAMIFKGQKGPAPHILAATTNGSFGNQTFGMTFGTLGCDTSKPVVSTAMFMNSNMDNIARDMSRGQGENLETIAVLLGVEQQDRETFRSVMHSNFAVIFPNAETTSDQAVENLLNVMKTNETLAKYIS